MSKDSRCLGRPAREDNEARGHVAARLGVLFPTRLVLKVGLRLLRSNGTMSEGLRVVVSTRPVDESRVELVLEPVDGIRGYWSKIYDGSLFLSMDAQSLNLLEAVPNAPAGGPKFRLKRSGTVPRDLLLRMRFVEEHAP